MNPAIEILDLHQAGLTGPWSLYGPMPGSILSWITDSGTDKNRETIFYREIRKNAGGTLRRFRTGYTGFN
jgi:hypothetical protein